MIHTKLIHPNSIVIVGGSDNPNSPGGKLVDNLTQHHYQGKLYVVNPKRDNIKNLPTYKDVSELPDDTDLAIIAIAAKYVEETVKILTEEKNTKAFIIISAGFSDTGMQGRLLEERIVKQIEKHGGSLLGPNNIGLINQNYAGVFTTPVPSLHPSGVDLISGSGATAVFIIEAAMQMGLQFNSIWTVGNSAQIGIEEVLEFLDENHTADSPKIKMLYIESIKKPQKFLRHSQSLIRKGCQIVAIKAGSSQAGSRAASSHTGALASPDMAVNALFDKAGITRVFGRLEMIYTAVALHYGMPKGKNIAIVTHAGGPGVMLTDVLEKNGLQIPQLEGKKAQNLLDKLYPGSSVANPIDFLATGTAEHLDEILTAIEQDFDKIDATAVIFGSPGLFQVYEVYDVLIKHIKRTKKPIYPILPSVVNVADEIAYFHKKGYPAFTDEVLFGKALAQAFNQKQNHSFVKNIEKPDNLHKPIELSKHSGYLAPEIARQLLHIFNIPVVPEAIVTNLQDAIDFSQDQYPVVLKVVGPLHKSDVGGVRLNINSDDELTRNFNELIQIPDAKAVMIQPQKSGMELFVGVKKEVGYGHLILFGMGGIYIEVLKDFQTLLAPVDKEIVLQKIKQLKMYPLLKGVRGQKGIDMDKFAGLVENISRLVQAYPEIAELDLNPVLANGSDFYVVDSRIKIHGTL